MKINLTQGKVALIDDTDADLVLQYRWYAIKTRRGSGLWYARNNEHVYLHRLLMGEPSGQQVDHKDGDGLNNRRSNLRICTPREQAQNAPGRTKRALIRSRFKGVSWHTTRKTLADGTVKVYGRWRAEIELPARKRKIKYAKTEEVAARLHDEMQKEYFGDFARLNFPDG